MTKNAMKMTSSISASILSFALTLVGFSKLELVTWWHFILAFFLMIVVFIIIFVVIEVLMHLYDKFVKRVDMISSVEEEIYILEKYIDSIYDKHVKYEHSAIDEYKDILVGEMNCLYTMSIKKILFIERFCNSPTIKDKDKVPDVKSFEAYKRFLNIIKNKYHFDFKDTLAGLS